MRLRWLVIALALAGVTLAAFALRQQSDRVTRENYDGIHADMTPADVEAILGPPGDYTTGPNEPDHDRSVKAWLQPTRDPADPVNFAEWWHVDSATVLVMIDAEGLMFKTYIPCKPSGNLLKRLLWRFERPWRRWFR